MILFLSYVIVNFSFRIYSRHLFHDLSTRHRTFLAIDCIDFTEHSPRQANLINQRKESTKALLTQEPINIYQQDKIHNTAHAPVPEHQHYPLTATKAYQDAPRSTSMISKPRTRPPRPGPPFRKPLQGCRPSEPCLFPTFFMPSSLLSTQHRRHQ